VLATHAVEDVVARRGVLKLRRHTSISISVSISVSISSNSNIGGDTTRGLVGQSTMAQRLDPCWRCTAGPGRGA
jgi:hypothetical protein